MSRKKSELEAKARTAIENARPDTALKPSPERLEARRSDFVAQMAKCPLEQREALRELLRGNLDGLKNGNSITDKLIKAEVEQFVRRNLPTPAEVQRQQEKEQSRNSRKKERGRGYGE